MINLTIGKWMVDECKKSLNNRITPLRKEKFEEEIPTVQLRSFSLSKKTLSYVYFI